MNKQTRCFHQIFKPEKILVSFSARVPGWGYCSICKAGPENGQCKGYFPVTINLVWLEDEKEKTGDCL